MTATTQEIWIGRVQLTTGDTIFFAVLCCNAREFEVAVARNLANESTQHHVQETATYAQWVAEHGEHPRINALALSVLRKPPLARDLMPKKPFITETVLTGLAPLAPSDGALPTALAPLIQGAPSIFALIDGSVISALPDRLLGAGVPHMSLLRGDALRELGDNATWLAEFPIDNALLRQFFTTSGGQVDDWSFWDRNAAVFFVAELSMEQLAHHLRRFQRAKGDDEKWRLFRFFDPRVLQPYLRGISDWEARARHWFELMDEQGQTGAISSILTCPSDEVASVFELDQTRLSSPPPTREAFRLTDRDRAPLRAAMKARRIRKMAKDLKMLFREELADRSQLDIALSVSRTVDRFAQFGVTHAGDLLTCAAWDIFYGTGFEERIGSGWPDRLRQPGDGRAKVRALTEAIDRNSPRPPNEAASAAIYS